MVMIVETNNTILHTFIYDAFAGRKRKRNARCETNCMFCPSNNISLPKFYTDLSRTPALTILNVLSGSYWHRSHGLRAE